MAPNLVMKIRPIILSGGSGTRLWPVSRRNLPKQFVPLLNEESLFLATLRSVSDRAFFEAPIIVGSLAHKFLIHDTLDQLGIEDALVILEPMGRNTAAAVLVAVAADYEDNPERLHLVRPSDHVIGDEVSFKQAVMTAKTAAASGSIVLFGLKPQYAETGYGYIVPKQSAYSIALNPIASFKEKPTLEEADALIKQGALWNSGIFFFRVKTMATEAAALAPDLWFQCQRAYKGATRTAFGLQLRGEDYQNLQSEPIDRAVMEKTNKGSVIACAMNWSDVGSWQSLWKISQKDKSGNAVNGPAHLENAQNCYVRSDGPAVALLGAKDMAVIATKDVILVAPLSHAQDIKELVAVVEGQAPWMNQDPPVAQRAWGTFENLAKSDRFQVRHVTLKPGQAQSLQMHNHRSEHWVVVSGMALVECDDVKKEVNCHQSIYIPKGSKHRLSNPGSSELHIIEVQSGDSLDDEDIQRFEL